MRTSALGITAPVESCTVPLMAPVAPPWAKTWVNRQRPRKTDHNALRENLGIHSSPTRGRWLGPLYGLRTEGSRGQQHAPAHARAPGLRSTETGSGGCAPDY